MGAHDAEMVILRLIERPENREGRVFEVLHEAAEEIRALTLASEPAPADVCHSGLRIEPGHVAPDGTTWTTQPPAQPSWADEVRRVARLVSTQDEKDTLNALAESMDDSTPAQPDLCPVCESTCPTHRNVDPRHGDPSETPPVCMDGWHNRRTSGGVPLSIDEFIGRPTFVAFVRDIGREVGAAAATAWLSALDDSTPDDPLTAAERKVLELVIPWSEWAAQQHREAGGPDANLLNAVKELRQRLKQAEEAEER